MEHAKNGKLAWVPLLASTLLTLSGSGVGCVEEAEPAEARVAEQTQALASDAFAVYADVPPYLDGQDIDEIWSRSGEWRAGRTVQGSASLPWDQQPSWKVGWDASALYVMVRVPDANQVKDSALPWEDDSVEIYLDGNGARSASYDADDYQLVLGGPGTNVIEAHGKPVPGVTSGRGWHSTGFTIYELRIPWALLNATPANAHRVIGFDVHVNDDDDGGARDAKQSTFALVDTAWTDPRTFGKLSLAPLREPTCPEDPQYHYRVSRAQVPPVIDGMEDPSGAYGWGWPRSVYNLIGGSYPPYSDLAPTYRLIWDAQYVYLFAEVIDDVVQNDSALPWEDDSVELYLDGANDKTPTYGPDDMQLVFGVGDATVVEPHGRSTAGITFATTRTSSPAGYRVEARVPWSLLGGTAPSDGRRIGFDVHVNDDDDGGSRDSKLSYAAWQDRSWADPSSFGTGRITECDRAE